MKSNKLSRLALAGITSGAIALATTSCSTSMEKDMNKCSGKSGCNGMKKEQSCSDKSSCEGTKKEQKCSAKSSCKS
jgi:hypothetical protein